MEQVLTILLEVVLREKLADVLGTETVKHLRNMHSYNKVIFLMKGTSTHLGEK